MSVRHLVSVTITGADDGVFPGDLIALGRDYPFVEWGILFSESRRGTPRYPSSEWVRRLLSFTAGTKTRLAAHLCGVEARTMMGGGVCSLVHQSFKRVQVNGWESSARHALAGGARDFELILQARSEESLQAVAFDAIGLGNASVLFDPSGGRGAEPFRWPPAPVELSVGYAGGIRPENVETVVAEIMHANGFTRGPFWIDMESGVRTSTDAFSLNRVREVLERVAKINGRHGA